MSDEAEIMASLVGRTITRAEWIEPKPGTQWPQGDEVGLLYLDDGRVIEFGAWGHDSWGATVEETQTVDVETCLHCGQPHQSRHVVEGGWQFHGSPHLPRTTFAFCEDGHHAAWIE